MENELSVLDNVLYADLNGLFLVVGFSLTAIIVNFKTIFIGRIVHQELYIN